MNDAPSRTLFSRALADLKGLWHGIAGARLKRLNWLADASPHGPR